MRKIVSLLIAATFVFGAATVSMAVGHGRIDKREYREQRRIGQGIRSGELTRREAGRLEAGLAKIKTDERFARMDGHLSYRERERLQRELNHESRGIYRQKHDGQQRNP